MNMEVEWDWIEINFEWRWINWVRLDWDLNINEYKYWIVKVRWLWFNIELKWDWIEIDFELRWRILNSEGKVMKNEYRSEVRLD